MRPSHRETLTGHADEGSFEIKTAYFEIDHAVVRLIHFLTEHLGMTLAKIKKEGHDDVGGAWGTFI
jgi:hypothetical protein